MSAITRDTLILRAASGAALIPLVLAAVILGAPFLHILVVAAAAILAWEWLNVLGLRESWTDAVLLYATLLVTLAVTIVAGMMQGLLAGAAAVAALTVAYLLRNRARVVWMAGGALYIALPCWSILWLRHEADNGLMLVLWVFLAVWASDIGAYAVGRTLGGPKLMPSVSPNKTWSGLGGAMASAAVVGVLFVAFVREGGGNVNLYAATGVFGAIVGAVGQFGDMFESRIKRRFNVKDMGALIPGHGGLFDRVDALMFVAPAIVLLEVTTREGIPL